MQYCAVIEGRQFPATPLPQYYLIYRAVLPMAYLDGMTSLTLSLHLDHTKKATCYLIYLQFLEM